MKKVLVCMLAVGLAATAANAATVRMNFVGGGQAASVVIGQPFTIEYWLDIPTIETTVGQYQFPLEAVAGDAVAAMSYSPNLALGHGAADQSFANNGYPAPIGAFTGFSISFADIDGGPLTGVTGSFLMGTATYQASAEGDYELAFSQADSFFIDQGGNNFVYDTRPSYYGYQGYYIYGNWGNPGVPKAAQRSPLSLHVTPEPASLALLAFGGFAALRRRR